MQPKNQQLNNHIVSVLQLMFSNRFHDFPWQIHIKEGMMADYRRRDSLRFERNEGQVDKWRITIFHIGYQLLALFLRDKCDYWHGQSLA
jgi:hypothetical protein